METELPKVGYEHVMNDVPCWVIDLNNEGAWFGIDPNMRRIDRHKGAFRRFGAGDYAKKK